ncbi:DUF881 domain-containing protein [Jatrophihabitans telluris]|uniref:DUF881 domain-containing protein n=1 Tax=Jatrophihabitans telluris TaxID=2038343 RepID=A0ABY4QYT7_9ACTN|nr:DUF881 domain-containing protein [Jatrophihabitans telluris]UQX88574.1 DUF881 domain-containing protein [Jatrophihabitans telluris]
MFRLSSLPRWVGVPSRRPEPGRTRDVWTVLVPVVALLAGLLAATTAHTARGTDLRSAGRTDVADLVRAAEARGNGQDAQVKQLQAQVAADTNNLAVSDATIAAINTKAAPLRLPGGLIAVSGPGLTVVLDDSHQNITDPKVDPNWLVVHQSDMQAAVNALWAGGAEAIQVMDQRLIQTSAIRCVGNTLLLNGRVYSPPFTIAAIGPAPQLRRALDASVNLSQYRQDAQSYGLRYSVDNQKKISIGAYEAPIALDYASIGG